MDKKSNPRSHRMFGEDDADRDFDDINSVASSMDCTGLTPTIVTDDEEADSYTDIYKIHLSQMINERNRNNSSKINTENRKNEAQK